MSEGHPFNMGGPPQHATDAPPQHVVGDPMLPQIRVTPSARPTANVTPRAQPRHMPEPYVHEFQPKTPERSGEVGVDGMVQPPYVEHHFPPGHVQGEPIPYAPFQQGPFTPGHSFVDAASIPPMMNDPGMIPQMMQPPLFSAMMGAQGPPGVGLPRRGSSASRAQSKARANGRAGGGPRSSSWDPLQNMLEEERERKREMKLLKNREAAREGREKKRRYQMILEARVSLLESQNRSLIEELKALKFLFCKPHPAQSHQGQSGGGGGAGGGPPQGQAMPHGPSGCRQGHNPQMYDAPTE